MIRSSALRVLHSGLAPTQITSTTTAATGTSGTSSVDRDGGDSFQPTTTRPIRQEVSLSSTNATSIYRGDVATLDPPATATSSMLGENYSNVNIDMTDTPLVTRKEKREVPVPFEVSARAEAEAEVDRLHAGAFSVSCEDTEVVL